MRLGDICQLAAELGLCLVSLAVYVWLLIVSFAVGSLAL